MAGSNSRSDSQSAGPASPIPDKLYFKIGEVSHLVGVQPHVLRYWEKEVPAIRPTKSPSNQRRYRRKDIELFREIRRLLYEERYTLAGAKKRLGAGGGRSTEGGAVAEHDDPRASATDAMSAAPPTVGPAPVQPETEEKLDTVRRGLQDLIRLAGEDP